MIWYSPDQLIQVILVLALIAFGQDFSLLFLLQIFQKERSQLLSGLFPFLRRKENGIPFSLQLGFFALVPFGPIMGESASISVFTEAIPPAPVVTRFFSL